MADYNSLDDGAYSTVLGSKMSASWRERTPLEKLLLVTLLFCFVIFVVIITGTVIDDRKRAAELTLCVENQKNPFVNVKVSQDLEKQWKISQALMKNLDENVIKEHLRALTKHYHPAGTEANLKVMDYIAQSWESYGLDVKTEEYKVLLSYPKSGNPNTVHVETKSKTWELISNGTSTKLGPPEALEQQRDEDAKLWWNAYAKPGTASGPIVYANHCTRKDFELLEQSLGKDFGGKIILCRYGWGWRGAKVQEAEIRNAIGVILYLDPADYGPPKNQSTNFTFPESIYVPPSGAQRGSLLQTDGDPQTPLYPAKDYVFRQFDEEELRNATILPNIPVLPVGYGVVQKIFQNMKLNPGITAPESYNFTGGIPNVTYYLNSSTNFKINVNALTEQKIIRNVFGYLYGSEEPDHMILLSNHVDAWTYGSQDPNSGTAVGLALSQAIAKTMNDSNWRPRRTLVFCGWDAEEYSLIGSTEWVEQKLKVLESRAVALINVDTAIEGNVSLSVKSVPLLYRLFVNASKIVQNPNPDEFKLNRPYAYDSWKIYRNKTLVPNDPSVPYMSFPAGGSDHKTFLHYAGVPTADLRYDAVEALRGYPLYHTMYELDWTMENLADPGFRGSKAVGQMWGEVVRNLADSLIIPFNVTDYAVMTGKYMDKLIQILNKTEKIDQIVANYTSVTKNLLELARRFLETAKNIQSKIDYANSGAAVNLQTVLSLNRRLIELERSFITPRGIPDRPNARHVIFATSIYDTYSGAYFAGVADSLTKYDTLETPEERKKWRKIINVQLTAVQYAYESVLDVLDLTSAH